MVWIWVFLRYVSASGGGRTVVCVLTLRCVVSM